MNENVENLILVQLREIRAEMSEMRGDIGGLRSDIAGVRSELGDVEQKVDGLSTILMLLTGHVHGIELRVEALEVNSRK